jgi:peptidoglycan-associated lipoprotein
MSLPRSLPVLTLALALSVTGGCRRKAQPVPTPGGTTTVTTTTTPGPNADSIAAVRAREEEARRLAAAEEARRLADEAARRNAEAANAAAESERLRGILTGVIHFEYDRAELRDDAKAALDLKVPILTTNSGVTIRIAGHTDNRGSDEYNLALAQRRAATAKNYLIDRGVPAARIETRSYGEEMPVCQQEDESCWSRNRRAEFQITGGPATLRR